MKLSASFQQGDQIQQKKRQIQGDCDTPRIVARAGNAPVTYHEDGLQGFLPGDNHKQESYLESQHNNQSWEQRGDAI